VTSNLKHFQRDATRKDILFCIAILRFFFFLVQKISLFFLFQLGIGQPAWFRIERQTKLPSSIFFSFTSLPHPTLPHFFFSSLEGGGGEEVVGRGIVTYGRHFTDNNNSLEPLLQFNFNGNQLLTEKKDEQAAIANRLKLIF
jgi:hypothetical protein